MSKKYRSLTLNHGDYSKLTTYFTSTEDKNKVHEIMYMTTP